MTREVYLSTLPVGYSGSPSIVNETNCNNQKITFKKILWAHFQFHSDLSHHDVLEECHILHCSGEIGSSTCSPDSRSRRFLIETAARKSDRSLMGTFLLDLFKVRYHCPWYLLYSSGVRWYVWSSFASSSISLHFCFVHPIASCDSRYTGSLRKIVNTCKMSTFRVNFLANISSTHSTLLLFLLFGFAMSSTMIAPFLDHVGRERVHPVLVCSVFFWIRCQQRIVRSCSRQFLDSNKEDSENVVLLV